MVKTQNIKTGTQKQDVSQKVSVVVNNILDGVKIKSRRGKRYLTVGKKRKRLHTNKSNAELVKTIRSFARKLALALKKKNIPATESNVSSGLLPLMQSSAQTQGMFLRDVENIRTQVGDLKRGLVEEKYETERQKDRKNRMIKSVKIFRGELLKRGIRVPGVTDEQLEKLTIKELIDKADTLNKLIVNTDKSKKPTAPPAEVEEDMTPKGVEKLKSRLISLVRLTERAEGVKISTSKPLEEFNVAQLAKSLGLKQLDDDTLDSYESKMKDKLPRAVEEEIVTPAFVPGKQTFPEEEGQVQQEGSGVGKNTEFSKLVRLITKHKKQLDPDTRKVADDLIGRMKNVLKDDSPPMIVIDTGLDALYDILEKINVEIPQRGGQDPNSEEMNEPDDDDEEEEANEQEGGQNIEEVDEPEDDDQEEESNVQEGMGEMGGLTGHELMKIMGNKDPHFRGVYALDEVAKFQPYRAGKKGVVSIIVNTKPIRIKFGHWVAVRIDDKKDTVEFYDPYGKPPTKEMKKQLLRLVKGLRRSMGFSGKFQFKINKIRHQGQSNRCGFFAARFLAERAAGKTWKEATEWDEVMKRMEGAGEKVIERFMKKVGNFGVI